MRYEELLRNSAKIISKEAHSNTLSAGLLGVQSVQRSGIGQNTPGDNRLSSNKSKGMHAFID